MQNHNNFSPDSVVHDPELPTWVTLLFKLYAGVFLGLLLIFTAKIIYFYTHKLSGLLTSLTFEGSPVYQNVDVSYVVPITILFISFVLGIFNAVAMFKMKRWVLPLTLLSSFFIVLLGLIALFVDGLEKPFHSLLVFAGIVMLLLVSYSGIKYWKIFTTPARRLLNQIPSFLLLLPAMVFASATFIFTDDPEIHDSDLLLPEVSILSQTENAHYYLPVIKELQAEQVSNFEAILAFAKENDRKDIIDSESFPALEEVSFLVDGFVTASDKKGYQCPTAVNDYSYYPKLCSLNDLRNLGILTGLRADTEAEAGNYDQAIRTAVSIVKMGALVGNSEQPVLIERLVGMALSRIGLETIQRIIDEPGFSLSYNTDELITELNKNKLNNDSLVASMKIEYMTLKNSYASLTQYSSYFYQHNKTTNDFAEVFRRHVEVSGSSCGPEHLKKSGELQKFIRHELSILPIPVAPNFIGKTLKIVTIASLNDVKDSNCEILELHESVLNSLRKS